jgi:hypothetical protein
LIKLLIFPVAREFGNYIGDQIGLVHRVQVDVEVACAVVVAAAHVDFRGSGSASGDVGWSGVIGRARSLEEESGSKRD